MNCKSVLSLFIVAIIISSALELNNFIDATVYKETNYDISFKILSSTDDAYYLIDYDFDNNSTLGYLKATSYDTLTGLRFDNVTLPVNATIVHAYLSLYSSDSSDSYSYLTTIYGIDDDDYATFSDNTTLTDALLTTAYSNWDMKDLENAWANSTDIKNIVQEIYDRIGWVSDNSIAFILSGAESAHGYRSFRTYDYTGETYTPILYIEYEVLSAVSNSNPWDYISDHWDNWNLLNETNGYTWWQVWNGSYISGVNWDNYYYNATEFDENTVWNPATNDLWVSLSICEQFAHSWNGTIYMLKTYSTSYAWLFNSTDDGITWSKMFQLTSSVTSQYAMDITSDGDIHIIYMSGTPYYPRYTRYSLVNHTYEYTGATNIGASGISTLGTIFASDIVHNKIGVVTVNNNGGQEKYYESTNGGTSWDAGTSIDPNNNRIGLRHGTVMWEDAEGDINVYQVQCNGGTLYAWKLWGRRMYGDKTLKSEDDIVVDDSWIAQPSINVVATLDDAGDIGLVWVNSTYIPSPYHFHDNWVNFQEYDIETETWSAIVNIEELFGITNTNPRNIDIIGESEFDDDGYFIMSYNYTASINDFYNGTVSGFDYYDSFMDSHSPPSSDYPLLFNGGSIGEYYYVLLDDEGNPVDELPEFPPEPSYLNSTIDSWLFEGEVYKLEVTVNNTDITNLILNDTVHDITFTYNNITDIYSLTVSDADGTLVNQLVAGIISSGKTDYAGNVTNIWWKFILNANIVDCTDRSIYYSLESIGDVSLFDTGWIDANITIYNLGGLIEYTFTGDGGHIEGGHPFELYSTNSTLNSTARADIIYRRLQAIHLLVELNTDNDIEAGQDYFEDLSNIGYYEAGFDYKLEGNESDAWLEGWNCRVYVDDIAVGTCGISTDVAYIRLRIYWYNKGDLIRGDEEIYSYHFGYDKDAFPSPRRSFTFWCDLWFDKANSSTVFGGRINPQYYGYYEAGSNWWFNSAFRPLISNVTSSMFFDDIKDEDGNIVSSKEISVVKVHSMVVKVADAGDSNTYTVKPYQVMKMQLAKERMEGIDTPDFIETQQLDIAGYGMYNILGGLGTIIGNAIFGVTRMMIGGIDTFLSFFGLPYGTFSTLMNYVSASFSSVMAWLISATAVFSDMLSIFTSLVTSISSFITYTIVAILFFLSDIFTIPLQIIQLIVGVINGESVTFYFLTLDFTPYKDLMDGLKELLPALGSIMYATWLLFGNVTFEGEPDVMGFVGRVRLSFDWVRDTYNSIFWIFNRIYAEILFIYAWVKSHIPTLGGTPSSAPTD